MLLLQERLALARVSSYKITCTLSIPSNLYSALSTFLLKPAQRISKTYSWTRINSTEKRRICLDPQQGVK